MAQPHTVTVDPAAGGRGPAVAAAGPLARCTALLMVCCAAIHLAGTVVHPASLPLTLLTVGVALGCLHCLPGLWRTAGAAHWVWATLGSGAMLIVHIVMLAQMSSPTGTSTHEHGHGHGRLTFTDSLDALSISGLLLPFAGLAAAWWALGRGNRASTLFDQQPHPGPAWPLADQVPARSDS